MEEQREQKFKAGSYIYIEGDEDIGEVFIVKSGQVNFTFQNKKIKRARNGASPGDIFGFISSLTNRPRLESAVVSEDSIIICMPKNYFLSLLQKNQSIAVKIINIFAEELRVYDEMMFSSDDTTNNIAYDVDLFSLARYYFNKDLYNFAYYTLQKFITVYSDSDLHDKAMEMLENLEKLELRTIAEPIKNGLSLIYADNQIVFCENEPGDDLYIIKEGKVKIVKHHENTEILLSVLKPGDIFGELAIVSDTPRNATAVCFGQTILFPINKESLFKLLQRSSEILKRIFVAMSQRVWFTYIRLESRLYEKPITRIYAFLENKLLEENISLKANKMHVFNFGINELFKMTNLSETKMGNSLNDILDDKNLKFHFGKIEILKPQDLVAKSHYFKSRDRLADSYDEISKHEESIDNYIVEETNNEELEIDEDFLKEIDEIDEKLFDDV